MSGNMIAMWITNVIGLVCAFHGLWLQAIYFELLSAGCAMFVVARKIKED